MKEKWTKKWTKLSEKWFKGDVTLPKVTLWLACSACLLAGIVYGLKKAPWTHGVSIGSNNGNNNGNNSGNYGGNEKCDTGDEEAEKEEAEKEEAEREEAEKEEENREKERRERVRDRRARRVRR